MKIDYLWLSCLLPVALNAGEALYATLPQTANDFHITSQTPLPDLSELDTHGKRLETIRWRDKQGQHLLILNVTDAIPARKTKDCADDDPCTDAELSAYHYLLDGKQALLQRRVFDLVQGCSFDLFIGFIPQSVSITDLDKDGIAEISMAYILACRSDVSPAVMKIIMLEGKDKYALRGLTLGRAIMQLPEQEQQSYIDEGWGKYDIDPAFHQAPGIFLDFAQQRWQQLKGYDGFGEP